MDSIWCQTTNQPNSFPWTQRLDSQSLAELLGWNRDGEGVQAVLRHLQEGAAVEVFTSRVPHQKGTGGVSYRLLPFVAQSYTEGTVPAVQRLVDMRRIKD